ncbi:hypothetical protein EOW77_0032300 [Bradyrhizobium yuanmingense]|uniref:hypothetical protein n=1 Tax=Bradyrhizobium yuanmingense TaxID=108015 RepID=UPI000FE34ABF|nr:hypothetical protein [Bradyrhizobium yuanmingense]TGN75952.1 hypothetical protein EOW77_0032300 [Bradyrhizobium yuanmingense]
MTAYLLHRTADGNMHLFADGAITLWDSPRVLSATHLKAEVRLGNFAYIVAGNCEFRDLFEMALVDNNVRDFDDLIANLPALVRVVNKQLGECEGAQPRDYEFQMCLAGWSQAKQRVLGYTYENSPLIDGPAFKLEPAETYLSPGPRPIASGAMNFDWPSPALSSEQVRPWGVAAMEAMRKIPVGVYERTDGQECVIGGHVQHVVISPERITSEIVHVWSDALGQLIDGDIEGRSVGPVLTSSVSVPLQSALARPSARAKALAAAPLGFGLGQMGVTCCLGGMRRG